MDHKVSKDMISSGMIPSGEKTQADLGRTQYGSAPSPSKLMDAYKSMYEHHKKDADGNTIPHEGEELDEIAFLAPALGKVAAIATKGAAMAGKVGKVATKAVTAGAKKFAKSNLASDMARGAATQLGANMVSGGSGGQQKQNTAGKVSAGSYQAASADLFDIVKGQLLDEGLSEEEIKDIMLTLTPDEIMEELSDVVKRNDAINKANAMKAAQERREKSTPPKEVTDAAKRQYKAGSPGAEPYTTADKKTIINYNKDK